VWDKQNSIPKISILCHNVGDTQLTEVMSASNPELQISSMQYSERVVSTRIALFSP